MGALHIFSNSDSLAETGESELTPGPSPIVKFISIALALGISAALLFGFLIWRGWHEKAVGVEQQAESKPLQPVLPTKVQILMDEPVRKGPQAIIGGAVRNISNERISAVAVEIQLTHRADQETEVRVIELEPRDLDPGQEGRYSLTLTGDYRSLKLLRIKSALTGEAIGFKAAPGARRPLEQPATRTIIVDRPSSPQKGEDFINTPDNPASVP